MLALHQHTCCTCTQMNSQTDVVAVGLFLGTDKY